MKRLNNRGFMMAEVIVVSSVVLITLTSLYISYNKVISTYKERINYYDVNTLYKLAFYRDRETDFEITSSYRKITVLDEDNEKCFLVNTNNIDNIINLGISKKYKEYLNYLKNTLDDDKKIMILEKCNNDKCKYAYIEITDTLS